MVEWLEAGLEVPALSAERAPPELMPHELFVLHEFAKLSTSRRPSMGKLPWPIPVSEIGAAHVHLGLQDHLSFNEWLRIVQMLDQVVIDHVESTQKKDDK